MKLPLLALPFLTSLVSAHFSLNYPPPRGENKDDMHTFPCGGLAQSSKRAPIAISSDGKATFPVAVTMGHAHTALEILLALGANPSDNFNITLHPTFGVMGLGSFCIPDVVVDEALLGTKVVDGMNATLQVQSNGDPAGGLYTCSDIQFSSTFTISKSTPCQNNTGISAVPFTGASAERNANESTSSGDPQGGTDDSHNGNHSDNHDSSGGSSTHGSSPTSTSAAGGVAMETAAWGMLGAMVVGGIVVL
ncbi:hypothetical protein P168DRAFT_312444 [Aspergillus campestris IBT 28561]|uniref:Copper acquisition factor BIM1-like domain-containing protein n=1 Tax=Aspergillus campestris (strain IBT 28561) TaxID=1392248 RepID=A0A2I1CXF3_ASPC2|nr:uncharacterized protein P168DRAFT_312444 [Aspergillus campestris IBT 28561]PKY02291.1 hypothetical protein P168DRAFT_312444 [Aspergillus campestris IBT 28561]